MPASMVKWLLPLLFIAATATAQSGSWELLGRVTFEEKYLAKYETWVLVPTFSPELQKACGKPFRIKGYVIPLDVAAGQYALSRYPFASCFFCGGAGPETVIGFTVGPGKVYATDTYVEFSGVLSCETEPGLGFPYQLLQPKPVDK